MVPAGQEVRPLLEEMVQVVGGSQAQVFKWKLDKEDAIVISFYSINYGCERRGIKKNCLFFSKNLH
jgi:hypothetical protein